MKIAIVQFDARLFDVEVNKKLAMKYVNQAKMEHADMVLFPEFFTTGFSLDSNIFAAVMKNEKMREWMNKLSCQENLILGGSWLEYDVATGETYNTYGLFFPTGESYFHRKDIPTALENFCYTNGDETMVFNTPVGRVGIAICWEQLRTDTFLRMQGKVDFVIAGSCWWGFASEDGQACQFLKEPNHSLAQKAPANLAKLLSRPLFHSSITGSFEGGSLTDMSVKCSRTIESVSCAFNEIGEPLCISESTPGIRYAYYDKKDRDEILENKTEMKSYWLLDMPKALTDGFNMLNSQYKTFYENKGKQIYRQIQEREQNGTDKDYKR